ncbi:McrB family protein [Pontibacter mangrovi]|uniref:AAA+ ATPase domain-containing protein n=1 Tax=Pontibacter mangrovi TaxID=2589816 RepID=A0A501W3L7_9BACT|nr:AAA family ATPase [Pontibacter mangrovi]TPE43352.1 hypothetical protein FJM65_14675 [Pontibacter mangrovi]
MKVWIEKKLVKGRDDRLQGEPILGKALWSGTKSSSGVDIYSTMRAVAPDDVILHLTDNYGITGVSRAADKFKEADGTEHSNGEGPAYMVPLKEFQTLDPVVTRDELLREENRELLDSIRKQGKVFYNKKLELNQGAYLTESPAELTRLINSIYCTQAGQDLPYIDGLLQSQNRYSVGADPDKWEELKGAVKRIDDREAVEKFFDAAGHVLTKLNLSSEDQLVYAAALAKPNRMQLTIGGKYVTSLQRSGRNVILGFYVPSSQVGELRQKYPSLGVGEEGGGSKHNPLRWVSLEAAAVNVNDFFEAITVPAEDSRRKQRVSQFRAQFAHLHNKWIIEAAKNPEVRSRLFETTAHYLMGAYWDGHNPEDQTGRFVEQGIWENGYDDKFLNEVSAVPVGSLIAIKSVFTREKTKPVMAIKARGKVTANPKDGKRLQVAWEKGFVPFEVDFNGGYWSTISTVEKAEHIKAIWGKREVKKENMNYPLNTIFYGPPGTGKTYTTLLRAAEIIEERKIESYDEAMRVFNDNLGDRIEFITFHQNYSYEDFIQGLRPDMEGSTELSFSRVDGVFKCIADRALHNLRLSEKEPEEVSRELLFEDALNRFIEQVQESGEKFKITEAAHISEVEEDAFRYTGDKWRHTNGLRMKFSDLREMYRHSVTSRKEAKELKTISRPAYHDITYYFLVYQHILKHVADSMEAPAKVERQNYVLIIDEINRANISRVFGELITLLEPDKRSHGAIPLRCTLPSGEEFTVPSNLYIIGTMNTADKSIALLDIALRRRFEFEAMYPQYQLEGQEVYDADVLERINKKVVELKGYDFQIGHAYFMGENRNLVERMNKKVIPLLLEYFMNDEKEVKGILANAGLDIEDNAWPLKIRGRRD